VNGHLSTATMTQLTLTCVTCGRNQSQFKTVVPTYSAISGRLVLGHGYLQNCILCNAFGPSAFLVGNLSFVNAESEDSEDVIQTRVKVQYYRTV